MAFMAIEASPVMMARLEKTLRAAGMFPRCSLHQVAVCDESNQQIDLHVAAVSPMNAKIGDWKAKAPRIIIHIRMFIIWLANCTAGTIFERKVSHA